MLEQVGNPEDRFSRDAALIEQQCSPDLAKWGCNVICSHCHFFSFCQIDFDCNAAAKCDLVHNVETIFRLC